MADRREEGIPLAELARKTKIPARTIRFYIARGLLPGPKAAGRGAVYGRDHLERIREIRALQAKGLTLAEIARTPAAGDQAEAVPEPVAWLMYPVEADLVVCMRADMSPWRLRAARNVLNEMATRFEAVRHGRKKDDERKN